MSNIVDLSCLTPEPKHSFVDKIHGLTDKLQSLSHLGHDSASDGAKGKAGNCLRLNGGLVMEGLMHLILILLF